MSWRSSISNEKRNMIDPIEKLADEQLFELALDVRVQLEKGTGTRPVLWLLAQQRTKAREAISKMVEVDATETDAIRNFQQEIRLYGDLIAACRDLIARGREADALIAEADRSDIAEIMSPEERQLHGFQTQGDD